MRRALLRDGWTSASVKRLLNIIESQLGVEKTPLPPLPGKPQWGNKMTEQAIKELQDIFSQLRDYLEALSKNI